MQTPLLVLACLQWLITALPGLKSSGSEEMLCSTGPAGSMEALTGGKPEAPISYNLKRKENNLVP